MSRIQAILVLSLFASANVSIGFKIERFILKKYTSLSRPKTTATITIRNRQLTQLSGYSDYDDDRGKSGLPLKAVIAFIVLGFGVFGSGFLGTINTALRGLGAPAQQVSQPTLKGTQNGEKRGAMTSLTRKEINTKLQSMPVFYGSADEGKSVFVKDGAGIFFTEKNEAASYFKNEGQSVKIAATSLDDVFYTLIEKKTKLGIASGVSGSSDPLATYTVRGSLNQYQAASEKYRSSHSIDDVVLFRVPKLVFSKEEGLEVPLFLRKEDALASYTRLQESKAARASKAGNPSSTSTPSTSTASETEALSEADAASTFQEISFLDIISLFKSGGFEGRSLEFYPSTEAISDARSLMGLPSIADSLAASTTSS